MLCFKSVKYGLSKIDDRYRGLESEVLRSVLEHKVEKGAERWKIGIFILWRLYKHYVNQIKEDEVVRHEWIVHMEEMRYAQKIFAGKPEEKEVETDERIMSKCILQQ